ncbi:polysaccharide deacetylase family protein [Limibacter armeniacum]|uniref:polysaccharide deacetylase family protein n=1 Tax=Limibacter armeniacum TaxID=466084 RepID=UPI002FE67575
MKKILVVLLGMLVTISSCKEKDEFMGFSYPEGKYKSLIMSYDDGTIEDIQLVNLFDQHHIVGTFNLNSAYIGATRGWPQENGDTIFQKYVPKETLMSLYKKHEIAAHGALHKDFLKVSDKEILEEISTDVSTLSELTGREIISMAYPFGNTSDHIAELVSTTGITNARTVADTYQFDLPTNYLKWNPTCHDSKVLDYLDDYLAIDKPELSLFYVWGHSWEFKDESRWDIMVKFCEKIGAKEDIWYVGTGEFTDYMKAIKNIEFEADKITNPTDNKPVWIKLSSGFKELQPGEEQAIKLVADED